MAVLSYTLLLDSCLLASSFMPYTRLQQSLVEAGSFISAAEAHGTLCGLVCGIENADNLLSQWLQALEIEGYSAETLSKWPKTVNASLQDDAMRFTPLLPDDEESLPSRLQAMAAWCNGLLYGFGVACGEHKLEDEAQEFIRDVSQISRLDDEFDGNTTDDQSAVGSEADYFELVEYLKTGMLLLYDACHQQLFMQQTATKLAALDEKLPPAHTDDATFH